MSGQSSRWFQISLEAPGPNQSKVELTLLQTVYVCSEQSKTWLERIACNALFAIVGRAQASGYCAQLPLSVMLPYE
jgi:hypothetical protein